MLIDLARDQSPSGLARLHYFMINKGPWSRLDHNRAVRPWRAAEARRRQFLSRAMRTKAELEKWIETLPGARALPRHWVLHGNPPRTAAGSSLVPYSLEYQGELARAAALLREAAQLATEPTLKDFLSKRAAAFLSNDYYDSDVAWMELKGAIEPTIGPYEVYEDELVQLQSRVSNRSSRCGRRRNGEAAEVRRRAAGDREQPADRAATTAIQSSARSRRSSW